MGEAFRQPQFSQAPAWLPPWLLPLPIPSGSQFYDTPPFFATTSPQNYNWFQEAKVGSLTSNEHMKKLVLCLSPSTEDTSDSITSQDIKTSKEERCKENHVEGNSTLLEIVSCNPCCSKLNEMDEQLQGKSIIMEVSLSANFDQSTCLQAAVQHTFGQPTTSPSQQTASTEIYVAPSTDDICNDTNLCSSHTFEMPQRLALTSNGYTNMKINVLLLDKCDEEVIKATSLNTTTEKRHMPEGSRSVRSKIKTRKIAPVTEDVEASIAQIVTAAEAVVVANVMETCYACQEFGPTAILDAALQLKRGRQECGLDEFTLQPTIEFPDDELSMDLDDSCLEEAFIDVGLVFEPSPESPNLNQVVDAAATSIEDAIEANDPESPNLNQMVDAAAMSIEEANESNNLILKAPSGFHVASQLGRDKVSGSVAMKLEVSHDADFCSDLQQNELNAGKQFASRWLGGWTGDDKQVQELKDAKISSFRRRPIFKEYEKSDISESVDLISEHVVLEQLTTDMNRMNTCALVNKPLNQVETADDQYRKTFTAASSAEIRVAFSQPSIMCSAASCSELLCSFVPCSISKTYVSHLARGNSQEVNTGFIYDKLRTRKAEQGALIGSKNSCQLSVKYNNCNSPLYDDCNRVQYDEGIIQQDLIYLQLPNGIKRRRLSSLKLFSADTNPYQIKSHSFDVKNMNEICVAEVDVEQLTPTTNHADFKVSTAVAESKDELLNTNSSSAHMVEVCNSQISYPSPQKESVWVEDRENKRFSHFSGLVEHESSPLLWHHLKKHRHRAYRAVESALSQDCYVGSTMVDLTVCRFANKKEQPYIKTGYTLLEDKPKEGIFLCYNKAWSNPELVADTQKPCMDKISRPRKKALKKNSKQGGKQVNQENLALSTNVAIRNLRKRVRTENLACPKNVIPRRLRGKCSKEHGIFKGFQFLLTAFLTSERKKLTTKIAAHGGVLLSDIPQFTCISLRKTRQCKDTNVVPPIIVAPQQVRTSKFLYGCAVGCLIVQPAWVDDCITARCFLPRPRKKHILTTLRSSDSLNNMKTERSLFFRGIHVMLHGQKFFSSKIGSVIQHGGGRVSRITKDSITCKKWKDVGLRVIVVEEPDKVSPKLRQSAAFWEVPIVSREWVVESLLAGKLLQFPILSLNLRKQPAKQVEAKSLVTSGSMTSCLETSSGALRRGKIFSLYRGKKRLPALDPSIHLHGHSIKLEAQDMFSPDAIINVHNSDITLLDPSLVPTYKDVNKRPLTRSRKQQSETYLYFKSAIIKGVNYSAGDTVEIKPYTQEETRPYVARIEGFGIAKLDSLETRLSEDQSANQASRKTFIQCRWYYHPTDTAFPCFGSDSELYFSEHYDSDVPIENLIRKVLVLMFVQGEPATCTDTNDEQKLSPSDSYLGAESAKYFCRYFYNHVEDSLHPLKSALKL